MGRSKTLPDAQVFAVLRRALADGGDRATAFSLIAQATGLAAPTLAQRYGTRQAMLRAALMDGWDRLDQATQLAAEDAALTAKGAAQMLKALGQTQGAEIALLISDLRDHALRDRALAWRGAVIAALVARLGGKGPDAAAILFAAWQGQLLWQGAGAAPVRLRQIVRRLV
jgi:AcrR family transcriptional regulator